ncbi:MAG TPA: MFS transporter, partial [Cytophagales bacterium]|nr:MFS transporter [Cytophagales bacterium]
LILLIINRVIGYDLVNKIGYKMGIVYGLLISAIGSVAMIASVNAGKYEFILISLFIIGLGFSLQQTCAQPFALSLGDPKQGAQRLSLAGGVNSFGTTIGPIVLGLFLTMGDRKLSDLTDAEKSSLFHSMNMLYIVVTALFIGCAALFYFTKMQRNTVIEGDKEETGSVFQFPQLVLGVIAIFIYVGVEVSVQSNLGELLKKGVLGTFTDSQVASLISLYWGSLMVGRWTAGASVFKVSPSTKNLVTAGVALLAFSVVVVCNMFLLKVDASLFLYYLPVILLFIGIYIIGKDRPATTLLMLSIFGVTSMIIGLVSGGMLAVYAFVAGGMACSIMWPFIFSLALSGLGKYTSKGSAILIMMILGGAIIPLIQGELADHYDIKVSYIVPVICFAYLGYFAFAVKGILKKQGIEADSVEAEGGH